MFLVPGSSGEFIPAAVVAGLCSSGLDVYDAGVLPAHAAAYLVADLEADFGVMMSASHNPHRTTASSALPAAARSSPMGWRRHRGADVQGSRPPGSSQVFEDAGVDVVVIGGAYPDGNNINDGVGSTHLGPVKESVIKHHADRCLAVDTGTRQRITSRRR